MPDSTAVFDPGWVMPSNPTSGLPYVDGVIEFYDAITDAPLEVFADAALTISLGTAVSCNSLGFPVSSGGSKTLIYVGADPYKVKITSAIYGGSIAEFDNVSGALDTSIFLTVGAVADVTVVPTSTNLAITAAHKGRLVRVNCTAGALTMTLAAAATLGSGFSVGIQHAGTANQVRVTGNGTNTFALPGATTTSFSLVGFGQTVWISGDGTNFQVYAEAPPVILNAPGQINIISRVSVPPGSPTPGARYIVTAAPSGAWSTFAEHDIAEATGLGGWFKYSPGEGQQAYVLGDDTYTFKGGIWRASAPTVQRFLSGSGIYTPTGTPKYIRVRQVGGGGGGGAQVTNAGAAGGTTTFGTTTAIGGGGGAAGAISAAGGAGGTGGTSGGVDIVRVSGGAGGASIVAGGASTAWAGGDGGNGPLGGGGVGVAPATGGAGTANTGAGGAGSGTHQSGAGGGGGAGEYVEFFVYSPGPTAYTVGAGGPGGAAGTVAGGPGGSGYIIIEEFA